MNKKILTITTIAVLVTSLMTIAMVNDAQALVPDTADFKCDKVFGSFFPPVAGTVFSSAWGDCSLLGQASLTSITTVTGAGSVPAFCLALATPAGLEGFAINEKGNIRLSLILDQCFTDAFGGPASPFGAFCAKVAGVPVVGAPAFSTVTGFYTIPIPPAASGLVDGKPVVGGVGTVTSTVDHCDPSAPFGNSFVSTFTGTIVTLV